jgi:hypothetical protein
MHIRLYYTIVGFFVGLLHLAALRTYKEVYRL